MMVRPEEEIFVPVLVKRRVGVHEVHRRVAEGAHLFEDFPLVGDLRFHVGVVDDHGGHRRRYQT